MSEINAVSSSNNLSANAPTTSMAFSPYAGGGTAPEGAGTATMSFDDFLDMINPLEHIPVISSIYRAIAGEDINPVSRIAGDTLYGGALGLASAGLAALGAVGDEAVAANNGGQTASRTVVTALFGPDAPQVPSATQLASADQTAPTTSQETTQQAAATTQTTTLATAPSVPTQEAGMQLASASPVLDAMTGKGIPLDRAKMPFGGVMDTSTVLQNAQQNQALALAMAEHSGALRSQHDIRNNRFAVAQPATTSTPAPSQPATAASATTNVAAAQVQPDPQTQKAMQGLLQELQSMKAVSQYQNAAQNLPYSTPAVGSSLDKIN